MEAIKKGVTSTISIPTPTQGSASWGAVHSTLLSLPLASLRQRSQGVRVATPGRHPAGQRHHTKSPLRGIPAADFRPRPQPQASQASAHAQRSAQLP
eukprot:CAMPEP_0184530770 /NCGR_PEP_ID=MMETSP0198_2-20121128/13149_1 /TAXON_ID=1112570 /ORGANISM="Thraustochytrium sp., Strain LLF1b" /LENGTH=96 /DNA_ID=CAMNT_0026922999 /DNA_START=594 /DNA_END=884 /DNA_ORIENTATION=+